MKKNTRVSRNIRACWFFRHLKSTITFTPLQELHLEVRINTHLARQSRINTRLARQSYQCSTHANFVNVMIQKINANKGAICSSYIICILLVYVYQHHYHTQMPVACWFHNVHCKIFPFVTLHHRRHFNSCCSQSIRAYLLDALCSGKTEEPLLKALCDRLDRAVLGSR